MIAPAIPENEAERMNELYKYELLDTVYEQEFDDIVQLASKLCNVPISLITLVDMNRQWFKAKFGLDTAETARNVSFCGHAILSEKLFEVEDAVADKRFFDNPLVTGNPKIRYYGGMPLITNSGYKIGTLCVIDRVPRQLDEEQSFALAVLSKQIIKLFELRIKNKELKKISDVQQRIMSIMAHDIRGPLASIKMSFELKNSGMLSKQDEREIDKMAPLQLDSTLNLLNNIVDWGNLQLDPSDTNESFNLHEACAECFDNLLLDANTKGNMLVNEISQSISMHGSRQGIMFVLRNLLGNANKFTTSGTIKVTAEIGGSAVKMAITDTGVGMNRDALESVTQRTWSNTTLGTGNEKGSGMGLKLIYEYLTGIGGDLTFTSSEGSGTKASVKIPVTE